MPVESPEYDTFEYKHFDEQPLSLEEAVKKAAHLRSSDSGQFHRIIPVDQELTGFRVESIPKESLYAEAMGRWTALLNRISLGLAKKR